MKDPPTEGMRRRMLIAAMAALAALNGPIILSACRPADGVAAEKSPLPAEDRSPAMPVASIAEKTGTGQLREDLEPLRKRFPLLGQPVRATWFSGTTGSERVPGPTTYWIDAVLRLPAGQAASLGQQYGLKAAAGAERPEVVPALLEFLPKPPWRTSAALDEALSTQGFVVHAYVSGDDLVLVALGQ
jgi:hypothetical protein